MVRINEYTYKYYILSLKNNKITSLPIRVYLLKNIVLKKTVNNFSVIVIWRKRKHGIYTFYIMYKKLKYRDQTLMDDI